MTRQKRQLRKKHQVVVHRNRGVLSEIVINLKTPIRTPGGPLLKRVSDRILKSPGTKQDHDVTRLIVSAVPAGKQDLLERRLEIIQEDPGVWAKFKALVHRNKRVAMGIAALLIGAASVAAVKAVLPDSGVSKVVDNITDFVMRRVYGEAAMYVQRGISGVMYSPGVHKKSPKKDLARALDQLTSVYHRNIADADAEYASGMAEAEADRYARVQQIEKDYFNARITDSDPKWAVSDAAVARREALYQADTRYDAMYAKLNRDRRAHKKCAGAVYEKLFDDITHSSGKISTTSAFAQCR